MKILQKTELNEAEKIQICKLWNNEYPEKLNHQSLESFENYLYNLTEPHHYLLIDEKDNIKGWSVTFVRDLEKWFVIIIDESMQGKGLGTQVINLLKENESCLNGWGIDHNSDKKINGNFYFCLIICI